MTPALPAQLPIVPFTRPVRDEVVLPGSKSITNRALLLAALCDAPVTLTGALFSEDTQLMAAALRALGFTVDADERALTLRVAEQAKAFPVGSEPVELFVGLAGTAARFLTALCASAPRGVFRLDGVPQMRKRPMKPLLEALRALGADIRCTGKEGFFPIEIRARGLTGGHVVLDASESSQLLSALLMVAPRARGNVRITLEGGVRASFVDMTKRMMRAFTIDDWPIVDHDDAGGLLVRAQPWPYAVPGGTYAIEPDATAASYFQALSLVAGGELRLPGLQPPATGLQGDAAFAAVLGRVRRQPREEDFHEISDTFLTLAAIAPLLDGPTRITGIAHTRKQETDRVAGAARELRKLGQDVVEETDALTITPRPLTPDVEIETYGDHRFAMSFAILGCHDLRGDGRPWLTIANPGCCAKTFPHFFELLESLRKKSLAL